MGRASLNDYLRIEDPPVARYASKPLTRGYKDVAVLMIGYDDCDIAGSQKNRSLLMNELRDGYHYTVQNESFTTCSQNDLETKIDTIIHKFAADHGQVKSNLLLLSLMGRGGVWENRSLHLTPTHKRTMSIDISELLRRLPLKVNCSVLALPDCCWAGHIAAQ